jgi:hypothetical protein
MKKVMWEEDAAVVAIPLFQEFQEGEEEECKTVKLTRKRARSCDDEGDDDVGALSSLNEEEEESVPAWMRYAPRRKLVNHISSSMSASDIEEDRFLFCGVKHSSNPFSPTYHKNVVERKQRQPLRQASLSTQKKKIKYLSNNVAEASELLSYFTLSKT